MSEEISKIRIGGLIRFRATSCLQIRLIYKPLYLLAFMNIV